MARIVVEVAGKDAGATAVMAKTTEASAKLGAQVVKTNAALGGSAKTTNSAAFALTNLGRVAQDAPFGFIGIQNNLNPLLESFQQLKAQSGSTGAALKALGSSLIGPAGIGVALSLVTAGLVLYTQWQQKSAKATEEAVDANKDYSKSLNIVEQAQLKGTQNAQQELITLKLLYEATQNTSLSVKERGKRVDELQEKYPSYFENIRDEIILAGGAKSAYDKLSASILLSAKARAGIDVLSDALKEEVQLQKRIDDATTAKLAIDKQSAELQQIRNAGSLQELNTATKQANISKTQLAGDILINKFSTQAIADISQLSLLQAQLNEKKRQNLTLSEQIATQVGEGANLETDSGKKAFKDAETRAEKLKKLYAELKQAREDFTISVIGTGVKLEEIRTEKIQDQIGAKLKKDFEDTKNKPIVLTPPVKVEFDASNADVDFSYFKLVFAQFAKDVNSLLDSSITNSAFDFGASIGQAFVDGGNVVEAAGQALIGSVGSIISEFGKLLIKAGVAALALQLVLTQPLNPIAAGAAIAAGIALVAIGAAVSGFAARNKSNQSGTTQTSRRRTPGFANGIESGNWRGGVALVGERGPELVNLPTGSGVIPNHRVEASLGRNNINITGSLGISMRELVLAIDRERSLQGRTG